MKQKDSLATAQAIIDVIGSDNVSACTTCFTRLRLTLKNQNSVDDEKIKAIPDVMGLIKSENQYQIVLGPGFVNRVLGDFEKLLQVKGATAVVASKPTEHDDGTDALLSVASDVKQKYRSKTKGAVLTFFNKISLIFTPFIPAFIAAGLLQSIGSIILVSYNNHPGPVALSIINFFTLSLSVLIQILCVIIGWNTAKVYNATPIVGAILGAMYTPAFGSLVANVFQTVDSATGEGTVFGIVIHNLDKNWLTVGMFHKDASGVFKASGLNGSVFGAIFAAGVGAFVEKQFNKIVFDGAKIFLVPLLTIFVMLIVQFFILVPITGYLFLGLSWFFEQVTRNKWVTPWLGAVLAGIWLWAVVFGVHQGATPIYIMLISQTGINTLFPLVAMAGASQVGGCLALYFRADKHGKLRKQISGAIVPGFLGIGEPLIYGVMLPRMKAFLTCCAGSAVGGLYMGLMPLFGVNIGPNALGPSGILAIPLMASNNAPIWEAMLLYLSGLILTYGFGFLFTWFFGWKNLDLK